MIQGSRPTVQTDKITNLFGHRDSPQKGVNFLRHYIITTSRQKVKQIKNKTGKKIIIVDDAVYLSSGMFIANSVAWQLRHICP